MANTKTFSISKEFEDVIEILDNVPNFSRFICEAVLEKYERMNTPTEDMQSQVYKAINNMICANNQFSVLTGAVPNINNFNSIGPVTPDVSTHLPQNNSDSNYSPIKKNNKIKVMRKPLTKKVEKDTGNAQVENKKINPPINDTVSKTKEVSIPIPTEEKNQLDEIRSKALNKASNW